jgi:hypothetical protein
MFLFATPFNELFLVYVAMLSLSLWSLLAVLRGVGVGDLPELFSSRLRIRTIAVYVWVTVCLNTLMWLRGMVPAVLDGDQSTLLAGTGLTTNPVYVQDLAWWLPVMAVGAWWFWRRQAWGYVVIGAGLTFWVLEAVGVAVDQAFGHAADPESSVAGLGAVWLFTGLAIVGVLPLYHYLHNLTDRR